MAVSSPTSISHGNSYKWTFNIKQPDGNIKDLTGTLKLKYQIAKRVQNLPIIQYTLVDPELNISDPLLGKITLDLASTTINTIPAGSYYHEIWQVNALGEPVTLLAERLNVVDKLIES